jgi:hypothetical protein
VPDGSAGSVKPGVGSGETETVAVGLGMGAAVGR